MPGGNLFCIKKTESRGQGEAAGPSKTQSSTTQMLKLESALLKGDNAFNDLIKRTITSHGLRRGE